MLERQWILEILCLSKTDPPNGLTDSCLSGCSYKGWPVDSGRHLENKCANLKVYVYRAPAGWHWPGIRPWFSVGACPLPPHICVLWLTQPTLSSSLTCIFHFDSLSDKHKDSIPLLLPPPAYCSPCLQHPRCLPSTRVNFMMLKTNRQWN